MEKNLFFFYFFKIKNRTHLEYRHLRENNYQISYCTRKPPLVPSNIKVQTYLLENHLYTTSCTFYFFSHLLVKTFLSISILNHEWIRNLHLYYSKRWERDNGDAYDLSSVKIFFIFLRWWCFIVKNTRIFIFSEIK